MSNYIQINNANNIVTINDEFKNYHFIRKFKPIPTYINSYSGYLASNRLNVMPQRFISYFKYDKQSNESLFFFKLDHPSLALGARGLGFPAIYRTDRGDVAAYSNYITVYEFGVDTSNITHGVGAQVYNSNGELIFDSSKPYLKILDSIFDFSKGNVPNLKQIPNRTYPKDIAVCSIHAPGYYWPMGPWESSLISMPNSKSIAPSRISGADGMGGSAQIVPWDKLSALVADVAFV